VNGQIKVKENYDGFASIGIGFFDWHPFGHTLLFYSLHESQENCPIQILI